MRDKKGQAVTAAAMLKKRRTSSKPSDEDQLAREIEGKLCGLAIRFGRRWPGYEEDFLQEGLLAGLRAAGVAGLSQRQKVAHALSAGRLAMRNHLRWMRVRKDELDAGGFGPESITDGEQEVEYPSTVEVGYTTDVSVPTDAELIWHVAERLLTPKEFTALQLRYHDEFTPSEVADQMQVARCRVTQLTQAALGKLRTYFLRASLN